MEFCVTAEGLERSGRTEPGTPACFQCETSGTGGAPKRIRRSQASWCASFAINRSRFPSAPRHTIAVLGGLQSSLALYGAVEALCLGGDLHLLAGMRPDRQLARIAEAGVSLLWATPTQIRQLALAGRACLSLRHLLAGGGRVDAATRDAAARLFPAAEITEFYGAAETSFMALSGRDTPAGSVGRPYPGVAIAIRGEDGTPLPAGETGEIWVSSPYLFTGYAQGGSGHTRRDGPWLTIGEMGSLDAGGHLFVAGRRARMVTIADRNVHLDAIEEVLLGFEGVIQAGVVALPDPMRGHALAGVLQCTDSACPDMILRQSRTALGPLAAPRRLVTITDWPQLASGKTDYAALRARLDGADG